MTMTRKETPEQTIPIASIIVGERRREDLGDIDSLASSIARYGLIHPVVIDAENRLIAGGRRLAAVRQLGWAAVDIRRFGDLSDTERHEIELEENLRRKDLTAAERTKTFLARVEIVGEIIAREAGEMPSLLGNSPDRPAGPPAKTVTQAKIAERMGVDQKTISNAQRHMRAMQKYPDLAAYPQETALKAAAAFDAYPPLQSVCTGAPDWAVKIAAKLDGLPEAERAERLSKLNPQALDEDNLLYLMDRPERTEQEKVTHRRQGISLRWDQHYLKMLSVCNQILTENAEADVSWWEEMDRRDIVRKAKEFRALLDQIIAQMEGVTGV